MASCVQEIWASKVSAGEEGPGVAGTGGRTGYPAAASVAASSPGRTERLTTGASPPSTAASPPAAAASPTPRQRLPHHDSVSPSRGGISPVNARVSHSRAETHVLLDAGGARLSARTPGFDAPARGAAVRVFVAEEAVLWFDAASGKRIR